MGSSFTDYKCNLDCHYWWAYNNAVKGISEPMAKKSVDWLDSIGNRVLALMGGEPLLRPDLVHKITYYAAKKGFFVYLPTNGRLMRPDVIDRLGDAGLANVNIALDSIAVKPSLPKALDAIRGNFDYLLKQQRRLHRRDQYQHLQQQPRRRARAGGSRGRAEHRDRFPHQRSAHDRAGPLRTLR